MSLSSVIGKKIDQTQGFLEDGTRVPLSVIHVGGNIVAQIKTQEKEGYNAVQVGFGNSKRPTKPIAGHVKKAGIENAPRFFREIRVDETGEFTPGSSISITEVLELGDLVDVTGTSKGKGYAGVVKRHGFRGGPRTHGQSDRERAPGSIGQTTTPGRVYKGKKMAGRMGNEQTTVKNLEVLGIEGDTLLIRGLIPGSKGSVVLIKKVGKNKKFMPLWAEKVEEPEVSEEVPAVEEVAEVVETAKDELATAGEEVKDTNETVETVEETKEEAKSEAEEVPAAEEVSAEEKKEEEVKENA